MARGVFRPTGKRFNPNALMILFINELSFEAQANNRFDAEILLSTIIDIANKLNYLLEGQSYITSSKLWNMPITQDLSVGQVAYSLNHSRRLLILSIITKGPWVETLLDDRYEYHSCLFNGLDGTSTSIAGAAIFNGSLLNLERSSLFDTESITVQYSFDNITNYSREILNVSNTDSLDNFIDLQIKKLIDNTNSWEELWIKRKLLFPELLFLDQVERMINSLDFYTSKRHVIKHLFSMNDYIKNVRIPENEITPNYTEMGIDASIESDSTLRKYAAERTFKCHDGQSRLFRFHSKIKSLNIRIHFYPPDDSTDAFIIGYIGDHLST